MQRFGLRLSVALGVVLAAGCNRQDADALSKIGQLLVQRAKALPISSPQSKLAKPLPNAQDTDRGEDKDKDN
jgi:hypothetical protein